MFDRAIIAVANAVLYARHRDAVRIHRHFAGRYPNIACPTRYSERMIWRRLVDHNPQFVVFSDKLAAKDYCRRVCPDLALPETLWVGRDADAIPDHLLGGDVWVKATHGCGFNHFVRAGAVDRARLKKESDGWLRSTYGVATDEWAYSRVEPRLFVERAVGDPDGDLIEFFIRAGNGRAILGSVCGHNKTEQQWIVALDRDGQPTWRPTDPDDASIAPLPEGVTVRDPYRRAVQYAERLSAGIDYARVDFLWNGTTLFGGEITVYPQAGMHTLENSRAERAILSGWDLAQSHFLASPQTGVRRIYANALRRRLRI